MSGGTDIKQLLGQQIFQALENAHLPSSSNPFLTGTGTQSYLGKFDSSGKSLGNSQIYDNGTNVGINTVSPNTKLDIYGDIAISKILANAFVSSTTYNNFDVTGYSVITGSGSGVVVTGFSGGYIGKIVIVFNSGNSGDITFNNEDSGSTATNRFVLSWNQATVTLKNGQTAIFMYLTNATGNRWILISKYD